MDVDVAADVDVDVDVNLDVDDHINILQEDIDIYISNKNGVKLC